MFIIGIVGSPRKDGLSSQLIDAALKGAKSKGAKTEKIYLCDFNIKPFDPAKTGLDLCPKQLNSLCSESNGIILAAPVYWGEINGLTKDFMDSVKLNEAAGKYALGIAIAGGTGKGLISAVQSLYHYFFHKQLMGINPTPVSRFNFDKTLELLEIRGAKMAGLRSEDSIFPGKDRKARWLTSAVHYAAMPYIGDDIIDEFIMLAEDLIETSQKTNIDKAAAKLDQAKKLLKDGKKIEAVKSAYLSYEMLYY